MGKIVLVLTGDPPPDVAASRGDYGDILAEAIGTHPPGYRSVDVRRASLRVADDEAVVISGSSSNVHKREPWMIETEAALRDLVGRGVPTLGVCFGHQLLAQALGGDVQKNPRGREISTVTITRTATDPLLDFLPDSFVANACHADSVVALPEGAEVLATSPLDPHQALRFGPRCYGVQFHPEFDDFIMRAFLAGRRDKMRAEGIDPDEREAACRDTPEAKGIFRTFLRAIAADVGRSRRD